MKSNILFSIDQLTKRDMCTEHLELLLSAYDQASLATLSHREKAILGPIEMRPIKSTFLSHLSDSWKTVLGPQAAKGLHLSCQLDYAMALTSGLGHLLNFCDSTVVDIAVFDGPWWKRPKGLFSKAFYHAYLRASLKGLQRARVLYFLSSQDAEDVKALWDESWGDLPPVSLITPAINSQDYQIYPENICEQIEGAENNKQTLKAKSYYIVGEISEKLWSTLLSSEKIKDISFATFSPLESLSQKVLSNSRVYAFGERCKGIEGPITSDSLGAIDDCPEGIPYFSLHSLACGVPVIGRYGRRPQGFIPEKGTFSFSTNDEIIESLSRGLESEATKEVIRGQIIKWHPIRFKSALIREIGQVSEG